MPVSRRGPTWLDGHVTVTLRRRDDPDIALTLTNFRQDDATGALAELLAPYEGVVWYLACFSTRKTVRSEPPTLIECARRSGARHLVTRIERRVP